MFDKPLNECCLLLRHIKQTIFLKYVSNVGIIFQKKQCLKIKVINNYQVKT